MKKIGKFLILIACTFALSTSADQLADGFTKPPEQTKPWCYWYWISDNVSKEGITKDLEAMARVGIGEALIGNIFLNEVPAGKVKVLTPEWWALVEHAIREGGRVGVNIGLFNCPGWSQSGGPWVKPEQTMRYLTSTEVRAIGPVKFEQKLPAPNALFQDVAVIAFPAPVNDAADLAAKSPRVTCTPASADANKLVDGKLDTAIVFAAGAPLTVEIELTEPLTARSLQVFPADSPFSADAELQAADVDGIFQTVRRFKCDWSNLSPAVGFIPQAPATIAFATTTARRWRLLLTTVTPGHRNFVSGNNGALAEIKLSGAARLESFVEKQLGKMNSTPLPMWGTYLWPTPAEPDSAKLVIPARDVRDLTKQLSTDGTLHWNVPPGEWVIQRIGMTPTGISNSPASPEGRGYEVDKMNRKLSQQHFDAFIGEVLRRMPAADRKSFKQVVADSYEMGAQNWTDGFGEQFEKRYGYDPKSWLPVLTGRMVGSANQSERFLWDLRRLVADRVATDYVGGLRDASKAHGLGLWLENYGHWGFPSEFLKYGSESDRIGGEFWVTGDLGSIECRAASSCANTYGKKFVSAESYTGGPAFQNAPADLKARGDWSFCEGVNHVVLHVYIHQPWEDKFPGINAPWGTEFNRHNTWFEQSTSWIEYLRRSCWLLQQGNRVADVAYFIGEDTPKMTGSRQPELPPGRDFDFINADVIERNLSIKSGMLTLPHGTTYRVLVLPEQTTMRPELLRKIRDLVNAGATVVGLPPANSPSMENFPKCDYEIRKLAREVWGNADITLPGERQFGKGRVIWGKSLDRILAALGSPPDFESSTPLRFTHRHSKDADIYFVANPKAETLVTTAAFRVNGKAPELWWPDSGCREQPAVYRAADGVVRMPLQFGPHGSVFVVFRKKTLPAAEQVVSVTLSGEEMLTTTMKPLVHETAKDSPNNFTFALWVKPEDATTLAAEANRGIIGMAEKRNDVFVAPYGGAYGDANHAGCGLAVGRNGICVFEHGAGYFAPTLAYPATLTNWTHVTVVYRDGQPSLYLNGGLARTGMKSTHQVHYGNNQTGAAKYEGKFGSIEPFARSLSEEEIAKLARSMSRPDESVKKFPLQLTRDGAGRITLHSGQGGDYQLKFADGRTQSLKLLVAASPLEISGPWEVGFAPGWGAPEKINFDQLTDWTQRPEYGIKYYSGKATYHKIFKLQARPLSNSQIVLDLGEVKDAATVRVNGKEFPPLWLAPWQMDITSAVKPETNTLEVEIANVWNNRLAGDASLPATGRHAFISVPTITTNSQLKAAGLLGPVTIREVSRTSLAEGDGVGR